MYINNVVWFIHKELWYFSEVDGTGDSHVKQSKSDPEDNHRMLSLVQNLDMKVEGELSERER